MSDLLQRVHGHLESGRLAEDLTPLFCETLRWGAPRGLTARQLPVGAPVGKTLSVYPVAQLSGLPVFRIDWPENRLPGVTARRAVHRALAPLHAEHLLCYVTSDSRQVAFTWARKRPDSKTELRTLPYEVRSPARTTIERLAELAFTLDELGRTGQPPITAVTDKLAAAFSVEAVTKRFYQEIANWYFWARDHVVFPMPKDEKNPEAYISQSLIRLITRLIFCWFVKQMGLIPRELFDLHTLSTLLKDGAKLPSSKATTFYKAILQNLFFATLNQEIGKREFRKRNKDPRGRDPHRGITNLYRYEDLFTDPKEFLRLVERIPFLNGGLFECLDQVFRAEEHRPDVRIDGFSDHPKNPLSVPDYLFFGNERTVDLSKAYGEAKYKRATVRGLIRIFNRYNFTVTESTPLDQEVALDPELAGKIFENLLASYNPETATTARKATGSYYTPREIVEYMVDEALIAYLAMKLSNNDQENTEKKLRHLLAYNDEPHQFNPDEVQTLITAIDELKALDPACGSGAFPMGLLHKLVHILGKLDPRNQQWKERQIARVQEAIRAAEKIQDTTIRERTLKDLEHQIASIKDAFARGELDYGRKLYLIENCIYGVDIQPIAVQIAKMRFFISLTVDQNVDPSAPNFGIRPLPNLETKFVAANTLIGIERPAQFAFRNSKIDELERELARVREAHFTARTPATKSKYRKQDAQLRAEIAEVLQHDGWRSATAKMLAAWDPYDQNASADFFDPEWMFGIRTGFDIVIGNPPYVRQEDIKSIKPLLQAQGYTCYTGTADLYVYFYERALQLLRTGGVLAFISSNKYFRSAYGEKLRALLAKHTIHRLIDFGDAPVFTAIAYPSIVVLSKTSPTNNTVRALNWKLGPPVEQFPEIFQAHCFHISQAELRPDGWRLESRAALRLLEKLRAGGTPLGDYVKGRFYYGIKTGLNEAFVVDRATRDRLIAEHPSSAQVLKPFLRGRDVKRWRCEFRDQYLIRIESSENVRHPWSGKAEREAERIFAQTYPAIHAWFERFRTALIQRYDQGRYFWELRSCDYWREFEQPKVIYPDIYEHQSFAWDVGGFYSANTTYFIATTEQWLTGLLNSSCVEWFYGHIGNRVRGGYLRAFSDYMCQIPIPSATLAQREGVNKLVEYILAAKRADPNADVSALEREIDQHVYRLYGLTAEEIKIVEEGTK